MQEWLLVWLLVMRLLNVQHLFIDMLNLGKEKDITIVMLWDLIVWDLDQSPQNRKEEEVFGLIHDSIFNQL